MPDTIPSASASSVVPAHIRDGQESVREAGHCGELSRDRQQMCIREAGHEPPHGDGGPQWEPGNNEMTARFDWEDADGDTGRLAIIDGYVECQIFDGETGGESAVYVTPANARGIVAWLNAHVLNIPAD